MNEFLLSERYRLELHWGKAIYEQPGVCKLENAYFSGPALADAVRLRNNDFIMLDFFKQYFIIVDNVYVAKFSWSQVVYNDNGTISLSNAYITHDTELNKVPTFKNEDYLVIDTQDHDTNNHIYSLVYKTYVVNNDKNLYKFER